MIAFEHSIFRFPGCAGPVQTLYHFEEALMKFHRALRTFLSISLIAVTAPVFAQQTGSITGKVTDTSGGVLPGVTIEARSNVLPGPRTTVTGGNGDYRLPALPPGEYTVVFNLSGMQSVSRKAFVQLSRRPRLTRSLASRAIADPGCGRATRHRHTRGSPRIRVDALPSPTARAPGCDQ